MARTGGKINAYSGLLGSPEGKGTFERPRSRWKVTMIMHVNEIGLVWWTSDLSQERDKWRALVKAIMNFRVP